VCAAGSLLPWVARPPRQLMSELTNCAVDTPVASCGLCAFLLAPDAGLACLLYRSYALLAAAPRPATRHPGAAALRQQPAACTKPGSYRPAACSHTWPELAIGPGEPVVAGAGPGRYRDAESDVPQQCGVGDPGPMELAVPDGHRTQLTGRQVAELVAARGVQPRRPQRSRPATGGEDPLVEEVQWRQVQRDLDAGRPKDPGVSR